MWKKQFVYCKKKNKLFGHDSYEYAPNNKRVKGRMLYGISTSRNLNVCVKLKEREIQEMADEWKSDPKSYFAMKFKDDGTTHYIDKGADLSFVVLVFDYNKLKQNHKIVPYSYVGGTMRDTFGDEQEEIVVGDIPNFMDYVVNVIEYNDNVNRKTLKSKDLVESKILSDTLDESWLPGAEWLDEPIAIGYSETYYYKGYDFAIEGIRDSDGDYYSLRIYIHDIADVHDHDHAVKYFGHQIQEGRFFVR